MIRIVTLFAAAAVVTSIMSGCAAATHREATSRPAATVALVPRPVQLDIPAAAGEFKLSRSTRIVAHPVARGAAAYLHDALASDNQVSLAVAEQAVPEVPKGAIFLTIDGADPTPPSERYTLDVRPDSIVIRSATPAGFFSAVQTLRQLLLSDNAPAPALHIADHPRYAYRGFMLDCSRHFMDVAFVKRTLDLMAYHKLNVFHWHLTDTNGWRLPIDRYPNLTAVGAAREWGVKERPPVFYTKSEVREVLAYAKARHIAVIPEIEMPGHCGAALAAYPDVHCKGGVAFCAGNEKTFEFLFNVLDETVDLFPDAPYIHVGGDERPKGVWEKCPLCQARMKELGIPSEHELQNWFMKRISDHLASKGKRAMSWAYVSGDPYNPTTLADLGHNALVQNWHGGAAFAARHGLDVVNSDNRSTYFDYPEFPSLREVKPTWMPLLPLDKVYAFDPTPAGLTAAESKHILGGEACLWTEFVPQPGVDYQTFPRLSATAEVLWSPKEGKDFADFSTRLATHSQRLQRMGVQTSTPTTRPALIPVPR